MDNEICIDLFTDMKESWMFGYDVKQVSGPNGIYYTATVTPDQKKNLLKEAAKHRVRYRYYEKCWSRSNTYRNDFFQYYSPPYRCRYCNRKLSKKIVVDHLIPVAKAKKSAYARFLLKIQGIQNVNDPRNLVPSCARCNLRKSDKMGLWVLRGFLGKYKIYWVCYYMSLFLLLTALVCMIGQYYF